MIASIALRLTYRAMRFVLALLFLAGLPAPAGAETLSPITGDALDGGEITLPEDLPADPTLLFLAFSQTHGDVVREWVEEMDLTAPDAPPWMQFLAIGRRWALFSGAIDGMIRSDVEEAGLTDRTVTHYGDQRDLRIGETPLSSAEVTVLIVRPSGDILAREAGAYTPEKAERILDALAQNRLPSAP